MGEGFLVKLTHRKTGENRWLGEVTFRKELAIEEPEADADEYDPAPDDPVDHLFESFDEAKHYLYPDREHALFALVEADFHKTVNLDAEVIAVVDCSLLDLAK